MIKGEKPIEKNVIVTDEFGKEIGRTYPRRARGLVKNGRAEYASDCEIRLLQRHTLAPENTEDLIMSNVINFNAREFRFDEAVENAGSRMFITAEDGSSTEIFEIGDWCWKWSQIRCTKQLEPNMDYIFRFAMTGGYNDTDDAVSQFIIYSDENWDDRSVYPLDRSRFKPVLSKRRENGLLRVYEIPFNSGKSGVITFLIIAQHAVAAFMPALDNEAYSDLEDLSYEQWRSERQEARKANENRTNGGSEFAKLDLSGAVISKSIMNELIEKMPFGAHIDLSGAVISED